MVENQNMDHISNIVEFYRPCKFAYGRQIRAFLIESVLSGKEVTFHEYYPLR